MSLMMNAEAQERLEDASDMMYAVAQAVKFSPMSHYKDRRRLVSAVRQLSELLDEIVKEAQEKYPNR